MGMKESWVKRVQFSELDLKYCIEYDPEFVYADAFDMIGDRLLAVREFLAHENTERLIDRMENALDGLENILDDMGVIYDK
jgi:hypothetical protein